MLFIATNRGVLMLIKAGILTFTDAVNNVLYSFFSCFYALMWFLRSCSEVGPHEVGVTVSSLPFIDLKVSLVSCDFHI